MVQRHLRPAISTSSEDLSTGGALACSRTCVSWFIAIQCARVFSRMYELVLAVEPTV